MSSAAPDPAPVSSSANPSSPRPMVEPRVYKGLTDYLPGPMAARQWIIDTIRAVCEQYAFVPLGTPAMEYLDVLTGSAGDEASSQIFTVNTNDEQPLGLRFDQTVPLARVIAQHKELPRPFRRYACAQVWRADKPDKGRYREFGQFDFDAVGIDSELADVEILAVIIDAMKALKVGPFQVRFSSRRVLQLLLDFAQIPPILTTQRTVRTREGGTTTIESQVASTDIFRVLDKLEKAGVEKVRLELTKGYKDESGDFIPGLGLASGQVDRIEAFLALASPDRAGLLGALGSLFANLEGAPAELAKLSRLSDRLSLLGYGDEVATIDLSIARGLAYYTGTVFETVLLDAPQYGSVCSGGRYDDLVSRFNPDPLPAVGASIGVDRLLAALIDIGRLKPSPATARVLVTAMDESLNDEYLRMAFELRRAGVPTELYLARKGFGKQIKHADGQRIPLAVVVGSDEHARGVVTIKEMDAGRTEAARTGERAEWLRKRPGQIEVPRADLVAAVKQLLAQTAEG
ncbi:MAG: histidine--tRNA ligase [Phycisphaerales bacterium]